MVQHLEERDHEVPLMAKANIKQYRYSKEIAMLIDFNNNQTDVKVKADMEPDDYKRLRDAMNGAGGKRIMDKTGASSSAATPAETEKEKRAREKKEREAAKQKKEQEEAEKDPEKARRQKVLDAAKKRLEDVISKSKSWARVVNEDLSDIPSLVIKLAKKEYPAQMG
eukprot:4684801-Pyramimonas_sp.AAC.1